MYCSFWIIETSPRQIPVHIFISWANAYPCILVLHVTPIGVPVGSPSRGGDVRVYVKNTIQPSLPTPFFFLFCSCVYFCLYGPVNCISFHKFSGQPSIFSLCSSGLISLSTLLALSNIYLFMKVSFSPDKILCGWPGWKNTYDPFAQSQVVSALSLTKLQRHGTSSPLLSVTHPL